MSQYPYPLSALASAVKLSRYFMNFVYSFSMILNVFLFENKSIVCALRTWFNYLNSITLF